MGPHKPSVKEHISYYRSRKLTRKYEAMSAVAKRSEIEDMIDDTEVGLDAVFGKYGDQIGLLEFGLNHCLQKDGYTTSQIVKRFTEFGVDMTKSSMWFGDESPGICLRNSNRSDHKDLIQDLLKCGLRF